jgi:hypothetical protein
MHGAAPVVTGKWRSASRDVGAITVRARRARWDWSVGSRPV